QQLLGYSSEEFVGRHQHDLISIRGPDGEPYAAGLCAPCRMLRDGQKQEVTGEFFQRRDGSVFPVEYVATPLLQEGAVVGGVVVFREVTERVLAQEALNDAHDRLQALLENLPDSAWMKDADLRFVAVNEAMVRGAGHSREEFLGKTAYDVLPPDVAACYESADRLVMEQHETVTVEELLPWGDPTGKALRWIETVKRPLPRVRGRPTGLVGIARDVTERKRREEADRFLSEAGRVIIASLAWTETLEAVAGLMVPAMADWCVITGLSDDSRPEGAVAMASEPAFEAFLREQLCCQPGRWGPQNELVGRAIPNGRGKVFPELKPLEIEHLMGDTGDDERWSLVPPRSGLIIPLIAKKHARGVLLLVRGAGRPAFDPADFTLVHQVGQRAALALEHARQHRAANEAVLARDEVLRIVAHDLRSLVATAGLSACALKDSAVTKRDEQSIGRILGSMGQMDRLIQDILDVSKVEAGRLAMEPTEMDAGALIEEAVDAAQVLAQDRQVGLVLEHPDELPRSRVDRGRALQVFSNLLGNAIAYSKPGGRVSASVQPLGNELMVCVRDNGPGIPEDELPHVFDRFWRARNGPADGIGLGLSIARGIVTAHGGRIWAASEPGCGSRFCFTLPIAMSPGSDTPVPDAPTGTDCAAALPDAEPIRVLVVDDHEAIRRGVRVLLEAAPNVRIVGEAGHGEEAINAVHRLAPDVVILDLSLPGVDGYDAMQQIIASNPDIRILVLTADAPEKSLTRAMKAGAFGFVHKATAHHDLLPAIRTVMRGEVYLDTHGSGVLLRDLERTRQAQRRLATLNDQEIDILRLTAEGFTANEIGERVFLSPHTVAGYRSRAMRKLRLEHRSDLVSPINN
ncbi:MAG: PAS domain-containing protein, partial [Gemmatimonadota bacterium]